MSASAPLCPVCNKPLSIGLARGRKSGKLFIMLLCAQDGRHFRGFINHQPYVERVMDGIRAANQSESGAQS
jgi:hypothetical protein